MNGLGSRSEERMVAHVEATGMQVLDMHNGWTEIHPMSKIEMR